mgnify:CR=1 FL=1
MYKSVKISIIFLFLTIYILADTTYVSGNVSGTWTTDGSPYLVTNNLVLQPSDSLTIDPGVEVKFDGYYRFDIFGTFLAIGTESDSILFTKNGSTNWASLNFADASNDSNRLEYCRIEYGSYSGYEPYYGAVNCNQSHPTISNNTISNCTYDAIHLYFSNSEISDNVIEYAVDFVHKTRPNHKNSPEITKKYIEWGAGPRASTYLILAAKAYAVLNENSTPEINDIKAVIKPVLRHRIIPNFNAEAEGIKRDDILDELLSI